MRIIPLSEGSFTIGKDKVFQPFDAATDNLQARSVGSLLVEVQPFCVVTKKDVIILDCGLGFAPQGTLQIHTNLQAAGIAPEAVTKVLMTHLHKDHAGGVSHSNRFGHHFLSFPNAAYFVQRAEYNFALETGYPSFIPDEFAVFDQHPNVFWLDDAVGNIDQYIQYEVTGGHSPFHQVFWIKEDGETIFFGGDDAPQLNQMRSRVVAKYDFDGKKCMELRHKWWQQGAEADWTFLFYHDVAHPFVKPKAAMASQVQ
ncbi:MAG: MBL fold metallo-hydrolase [Bacteroidetes bacterium]|nr:MAG: MBL fold metallo-hydrolase [Bacteroidota bacterium]